MRGGLGRTLLSAFLVLTILPLGVIGGYAIQQNQRNLEMETASKLLSIAALKQEQLIGWLGALHTLAAASLPSVAARSGIDYGAWWAGFALEAPAVAGAAALDLQWQLLWATESCTLSATDIPALSDAARAPRTARAAVLQLRADAAPVLGLVVPVERYTVVLCLSPQSVADILATEATLGATGQVDLIVAGRQWPSGALVKLPPIGDVESARRDVRYGLYDNLAGEAMVGAYHPVAGIDGGILVEQQEAEVLATTERMVATLIAMVLAVALATTAISAVVIRQITRPVIDLTESAVAIAEGDLDQHVNVRSRDEIGILTYVYNEMATELKSLYEDLEAKVVERTRRLQQVNYQLQRRALHLQASQQVSQAVTSVRDPGLLLMQVADLICNHFVYSSVAVYLVAPGGGEARLQASSPRQFASRSDVRHTWPDRCRAGDGSIIGRAIRRGEVQVANEPAASQRGWYGRVLSRVAIPLKMEERIGGVIAVVTTAHEGIQQDELEVLEALGNQVTIALENARAYERERDAMEQLEAAEAFKARFLANMSRELREPLNTVIGFSRLLIKGLDGPLSPRQVEDLEQIHNDSQRLLFLINDILAISEIQAGLMELRLQPVDLGGLVDGIMPTANALVNGKDVVVKQEIADDLPMLHADPSRLRQVLVHLLTNAAKFTDSGWIVIRAWANEEEVYVSVNDTGIGIPVEDRERIFAYFEKGRTRQVNGSSGIGLGLALCREYVEAHGGRIWVDSEVNVGSTFSFSVPAYPVEPRHRRAVRRTESQSQARASL